MEKHEHTVLQVITVVALFLAVWAVVVLSLMLWATPGTLERADRISILEGTPVAEEGP